jgi:hypothetical protein
MVHVQPGLRIALYPAMPRHPGRLAADGRFIFSHFRLHREVEGGDPEVGARTQLGTRAVMESDIGDAAIAAITIA